MAAAPAARRAAALTVTDSLTERFGAFIIIVLGETLTGVVGGLASQPVGALTMAVGLVAIAAMVSLVDHAHEGRTPAATAWSCLRPPPSCWARPC